MECSWDFLYIRSSFFCLVLMEIHEPSQAKRISTSTRKLTDKKRNRFSILLLFINVCVVCTMQLIKITSIIIINSKKAIHVHLRFDGNAKLSVSLISIIESTIN